MPSSKPSRVIAPTQRVFLVRHGLASLNAEGRLRGQATRPWTRSAGAEAAALAAVLSAHHVVKGVTSPLLRALQTAEVIADATGAPTAASGGLVDRDYGDWAGALEADVVRQWGRVDQSPGAESAESVRRRSRSLLEAHVRPLDEGNVVFVTHDAVLHVLLSDLGAARADGEIRQRTGCWDLISRHPSGWTVELVDQVSAAGEGTVMRR